MTKQQAGNDVEVKGHQIFKVFSFPGKTEQTKLYHTIYWTNCRNISQED
jgi:hypothetical protein